MRRRQAVDKFRLPAKLAKFDPADWPQRNDSWRMVAWSGARQEWKDANGVDFLPGDDEIVIPDEPWDPDLV